jgi:hypothetical protein
MARRPSGNDLFDTGLPIDITDAAGEATTVLSIFKRSLLPI